MKKVMMIAAFAAALVSCQSKGTMMLLPWTKG